jgi:hypothetical protein
VLLTLALTTLLALPTDRCGVINDVGVRADNERARRQRVRLLRGAGSVVELVYAGKPLRAPIDSEAIGVRLAPHPQHAEESDAAVLVVVDDGTDRRCPPFLARVDDSLSNDLTLLGIVGAGALFARGDALFFARMPTTPEMPTFRLAWQSSFTLSYPRPASSKPVRPPAKRR